MKYETCSQIRIHPSDQRGDVAGQARVLELGDYHGIKQALWGVQDSSVPVSSRGQTAPAPAPDSRKEIRLYRQIASQYHCAHQRVCPATEHHDQRCRQASIRGVSAGTGRWLRSSLSNRCTAATYLIAWDRESLLKSTDYLYRSPVFCRSRR